MSPAVLETLNTVLSDIFKEYDGLFTSVKVKDFLFGGIAICANVSKDDFATKMICDQFKAKAKKTSTMRIENKTLYFSNFHHVSVFFRTRSQISFKLKSRKKLIVPV